MTLLHVVLLAIVQGLAELLPVSSSAHVVVAERLLGLDPTTPAMTLLLVMLHTGTVFAIIAYFWRQWAATYFSSADAFKRFLIRLLWASAITGIVGEALIKLVEHTLFRGAPNAQIEDLFGRLDLVAPALAVAGILILIAGLHRTRKEEAATGSAKPLAGSITRRPSGNVTMGQAGWMGLMQGLALPFRGLSRSGVTISIGMLTGAARDRAERFSFAMAVAITPFAIGREALRVVHAKKDAVALGAGADLHTTALMSLVGMVCAFIAGLVALKWLSNWLESGRWYLFGVYCLAASVAVFWLHTRGY